VKREEATVGAFGAVDVLAVQQRGGVPDRDYDTGARPLAQQCLFVMTTIWRGTVAPIVPGSRAPFSKNCRAAGGSAEAGGCRPPLRARCRRGSSPFPRSAPVERGIVVIRDSEVRQMDTRALTLNSAHPRVTISPAALWTNRGHAHG
jgi:hypothetical protein